VRTAAAQLTEQDLTRRIPVAGRDDVAALAETFNAMLDRLERAFAVQRQFVDDAGHELRTPITIVRGHLELMGDDPAEREETVRLVTDELDRMSRIVEDLLLLAKAERPDFVTPEPVQLAELTADVYVKARTLGDRDWRLAEIADREARLDPQRITQAMVQLAQNAVQHTATGQTIRIGSRADGERIELYVADSGPGVRPEDTELIFERFRRGTTRRGARGSGAGLGLSIVKAIAEGHGGRVRLQGATPAQVEHLSAGLENWAYVLTRDLGVTGTDLRTGPGTGASGGLGAGLAALGARLLPRFDVLLGHLDLDARLARADLVVTAEGALDHQTPRGKVPAEVAGRAKRYGRPVLALAGTLGEGAHEVPGVDAFSGILPAPMALAEALVRASELLADAAERALRMILLGARLPAHAEVSGTQRPSSVR